MSNWKRIITAIVVVCSSTPLLSAPKEPESAKLKGEIIEYGYYQAVSEIARSRNKATPTGFILSGGEVELVKQATDIPSIQGLLFGFRFRISGYPKRIDQAWLRLVVTHPLIIRPNGSRAEGYSYPLSLKVKDGVIEDKSGYKLDNEYEMIAGDWSFQYWNRERMLVEQKFTVRAATEKDQQRLQKVKQEILTKIENGFYVTKAEEKKAPEAKLTERLKMPGS